MCWRCHPQCAHGGWVVSHLRSGTGETDPPTHAHTTLPRRSNPGAAYTCVCFSTCVLVCYLWWVGLKQISTPLVQFKHTGTILHTTAQLMRDNPEPRKVSDDTSTWLKTEPLAFPLSLFLPSHMHLIPSLSSPFSLFIPLSLGEHGLTKRPAWLYCCDGLWMSFTACKWRALHLSMCLPYSLREGAMCYYRGCWLCRFRAELSALWFDSLIKHANLLSLYITLGVPLKVPHSQASPFI